MPPAPGTLPATSRRNMPTSLHKSTEPGPGKLLPATPADTGTDPWAQLRRHTDARIALGRTGGSQRTDSLLNFRLAHANARDAVHAQFDTATLATELAGVWTEGCEILHSAADSKTFLTRPDLGRKLSPESRAHLLAHAPQWGRRDIAVIVSDGLSANAAHGHAAATLGPLRAQLAAAGWTFYPLFIAPFGRVKLQDEIGAALGARLTLMLLGERPGLDSCDSLGAYFTHNPRETCTDAHRNCVSNIRPAGVPPESAACKLAGLLMQAMEIGASVVVLKERQVLL